MSNIPTGFPIVFAYTLSVALVEAIQGGRTFVGKNDVRRLLEWYTNTAYPWNATLFSRDGESDEGRALYLLMRHAHSKNAMSGIRRRSSLFDRVVAFMSRFPHETYSHHDLSFALNFFNDLARGIRDYRVAVKRRKKRASASGKVLRLRSRTMQHDALI